MTTNDKRTRGEGTKGRRKVGGGGRGGRRRGEREKKRSFKVEHGWLVKRRNGGQPLNILYF